MCPTAWAQTKRLKARVRVAAPFTCVPMRKAAMRTAFALTVVTNTAHVWPKPSRSLKKQEFHSMSDLNFDPFQFAGRRRYAVAAEYTLDGWTSNGIAHEDFTRMQA